MTSAIVVVIAQSQIESNRQSKYVNKEKWKDFPTLSSFNFKASSIAGIIERGINEICSQFCPAAPRGFRQFCGAGRGGAACFSAGRGGAGRGVHPWFLRCLSMWCSSNLSQFQSVLSKAMQVSMSQKTLLPNMQICKYGQICPAESEVSQRRRRVLGESFS